MGSNAAVVALICSSVVTLGKHNLKDVVAVGIFFGVLLLVQGSGLISIDSGTPLGMVFSFILSPAGLIILSGVVGYTARRLYSLAKGGEGK